MDNLINTEADFWKNVQDPVSRIKDKTEIFRLSIAAHEKFPDAYIKAASLAIALHRMSEDSSLKVPDSFDIPENINHAISEIQFSRDFTPLRWFLSLNIAAATYYKTIGEIELSSRHLELNIAKLDLSMKHGQPFTNIVKSAGLWIGLQKLHADKLITSETKIKSVLNIFKDCSNSITTNYKFTNEWAYEELGLVFVYLYEITKCLYKVERKETLSYMEAVSKFNVSILPTLFR
jgi:hypothetical protein